MFDEMNNNISAGNIPESERDNGLIGVSDISSEEYESEAPIYASKKYIEYFPHIYTEGEYDGYEPVKDYAIYRGKIINGVLEPDSKAELVYFNDVKAHVAENDNTRVVPKPRGVPAERRADSFTDGVNVALEGSGHAWKYIGKEAQKIFTKDPEKRERIENEQRKIVEENSRLPRPKGLGTAGAAIANITTTALPAIVATALGGAPAGTAVGGGLMLFDAAKSGAQANMEMDAYEKATGKKIDEERRFAYTTASVATDVIMNALMGSKVFGEIAPAAEKAVSNQLKKAIMDNPVAQAEFNTMTRNVMKQERDKWAKINSDYVKQSAIDGGLSSAALEAEKSIYTDEMPELKNIIGSAVGGAMAGAAQGAGAKALQPRILHHQRNRRDDIFYGSNTTHVTDEKRLPISEFRPTQMRKNEDGKVYVEGNVVTPEGASAATLPVENISTGSYRKAHKSGATEPLTDDWNFTEEQMSSYKSQWENAQQMKKEHPEEAYQEQSRIVQEMAAQMGIPVNVYAKLSDLPPDLEKDPEVIKSYAFTTNNNTIDVVLDQLDSAKAENLPAILRHEALGHFGLGKTYEKQADYERDLYQAGKTIVPEDMRRRIPTQHSKNYEDWLRRIEERASRQAEPRNYLKDVDADHMYKAMYDMLRRSEDNLRSTTINELKKDNDRRGNPMPTMYEREK